MTKAQRYTCTTSYGDATMEKDNTYGEWVHEDDVAELERECAELRTRLEQVIQHNDAAVQLGYDRGARITQLEAQLAEYRARGY